MTENKALTRWTTGMLIADALIVIWDMGLATYNFIQGRWIAGVGIVAVAGFLLWSIKSLLEVKHDTERMRMRHDYMMKVYEKVYGQPEADGDIVEGEKDYETDAH